MRKAKQSTAKNVMVLMVDSADHITGKTGLTLTITASKDGAAFGSISPAVTERGNGWYSLALTASHTDTLGDLALHITGAAADPADMVLLVEARSVDDVLPAASYTAPLDAAGTRAAVGLAAANLDTQLAAIYAVIDTEVSAILAAVDTEVAAIKAKTDNLPADTAAQLTALLSYVDEMESRLTAVRAGLLDNLTNLDAAVSSLPSAAANAAEVLAEAQTTPIHARVKFINNTELAGAGTPADPMRPA